MIKRIKKLWVSALRSNKYTQGRYALKMKILADDEFQHCCLGVLCEIVKKEMGIRWKISKDNKIYREFDNSKGSPTTKVLKKTGIDLYQVNHLMNLNDCQNKNFNEIANWIEKNL